MHNLIWLLYFLSLICARNNITVNSLNIQIQIGNFNLGTLEKSNHQVFLRKLKSNKSVVNHKSHLRFGNKNAVWVKPRIIGGWDAKLGEVPYQVSFKRYEMGVWRSFCGGSIVTDRKIVTAAHCIASHRELSLCLHRLGVRHLPLIEDFSRIYAVAGSLYNKITSESQSDVYSQWRKIIQVRVPDDYQFPMNDISIITVKDPFIFNKFVTPVPLATSHNINFTECLIAGFGNTIQDSHNTPVYSEKLKYSKVTLMPKSSCDSTVNGDTIPFVCTNDTYKTSGCGMGDSGGPLVCKRPMDPNDQGFGVLVGVVCAGHRRVSIYSRVVYYSKFITKSLAVNLQRSIVLILLNVLFMTLNLI